MALIREACGKDPSAPPFSDPVTIEFRSGVAITETKEFRIPEIGVLKIHLDDEEGVISLEIAA